MSLNQAGAVCFGVVIGYIVYRTLRRTTDVTTVSDIASVVGAVGGAAVTSLFNASGSLFGCYSLGLAVGFFLYLILGHTVLKNSTWLGPG